MTCEGEEAKALRAENAELRRRLHELSGDRPFESIQFLRSLLDALPAFVMHTGPDLTIRYVNRLLSVLDESSVLGHSVLRFIEGDYRQVAERTIEEVRQSGRPARYSVRGMGEHGRIADYETIVACVPEPDGTTGFVFAAFDVTEQAERARELERSQQRLELAVSGTGIGLWSWDSVTGEIEWSPRMHEIVGLSQALPPPEYVRLVVHPEDRPSVQAALEKLQSGEASRWISHRIVRPDGEVRWILPCVSVTPSSEGRGIGLIGGSIDVTQVRTLEERLRQAERMESLGTLTAGVAHNFNNLLAVIRASLDLIGGTVTDEARAAHADALHATERAAEVVRQLMTFAGRRRASRIEHRSLADLASSAVRLCQRSFGAALPIELKVSSELPIVACDPAELEQVLVNLLVNARDAVIEARPLQPRIEVCVEVVEPPESLSLPLSSPTPTPSVSRFGCVAVTDNGVGMDASVQKRVFDPFFSTKGPARGTGLGLAMSWAVVRSLGGTIQCESTPKRGTRFCVCLPALAVERGAAATAPSQRPAGAAPVVLLVDDDDYVRRVIRRILVQAGHVTLEAASAEQGVQVAERNRGKVDAVLLDQSLPDARGVQIVPALRERLPGAKIFLFTGDDVPDEEVERVDGLLMKPLSAELLLSTLANVSVSR